MNFRRILMGTIVGILGLCLAFVVSRLLTANWRQVSDAGAAISGFNLLIIAALLVLGLSSAVAAGGGTARPVLNGIMSVIPAYLFGLAAIQAISGGPITAVLFLAIGLAPFVFGICALAAWVAGRRDARRSTSLGSPSRRP